MKRVRQRIPICEDVHARGRAFGLLRLVAVAFILSALCGCSYAKRAPAVRAGRAFDVTVAEKLKTGGSALLVLDVLGPPLSVTKDGTVARWRYYQRVNMGDTVRLFGILPWKGSNYWSSTEVIVTVSAGEVESISVRKWNR